MPMAIALLNTNKAIALILIKRGNHQHRTSLGADQRSGNPKKQVRTLLKTLRQDVPGDTVSIPQAGGQFLADKTLP